MGKTLLKITLLDDGVVVSESDVTDEPTAERLVIALAAIAKKDTLVLRALAGAVGLAVRPGTDDVFNLAEESGKKKMAKKMN